MSEPDAFDRYLAEMPSDTRSIFAMIFEDTTKDHRDRHILEALDTLDLPMLTENDDPHWIEGGAFESDVYFYDPNGRPFPGDAIAQARAFEATRLNVGETHFVTSLWAEDVPVWVSTVYLGCDHAAGFFGRTRRPPVLWETMIQTNFSWSSWQSRYCTKAAAQQAHTIIVGCLMKLGLVLAEAETS